MSKRQPNSEKLHRRHNVRASPVIDRAFESTLKEDFGYSACYAKVVSSDGRHRADIGGNERLLELDALRGIAACVVVSHHIRYMGLSSRSHIGEDVVQDIPVF